MGEVGKRLGGFTLVLAGAFGFSYAVGERLPGHSHTHSHAANTTAYQLTPEPDGRYTLRAQNGTALTSMVVIHQALLHVIVVRPDLSAMIHIHPTPAADGSFDVPAPDGGPWRIFAEALPSGQTTPVVGHLDVGDDTSFTPAPLPAEAPTATTSVHGETITVTRDGMEFTVTAPRDTEPYLGMPAHLIVVRSTDLAFFHLHPVTTGPNHFVFDATGLGDGPYRVFLQFTYDGTVATIPMTMHRGADQG
jgi:hypothetical protein